MRHELAVLRTDYEELTRSLEQLTFEAFKEIQENKETEEKHSVKPVNHPLQSSQSPVVEIHSEVVRLPFGAFRTVDEDGVFGRMGVLDGDRVLMFGSITKKSYADLRQFGGYVASCRGKSIELEVERDRNGAVERMRTQIEIPKEGSLG